ncbi:transporter substrate-binding domain-containing protein [Marinobacter daepoensis]|uniref:Amino acid ABC transporter substrate-binding protein n=1 Tax=Marinobacter daepoensis TaxID=262077 RepID=A0ABS3BA72_9GAMM|nr:transporter substrate-binding domain-containing protein [Marinobacter daepoensis]MBN7768713.1 amino acid ABC transporter substrate-binding protein [Marinobacter daepoensis]MBY6079450.1 transporter substrate-binding domain-containing protein [Marinobacter daepoensis]
MRGITVNAWLFGALWLLCAPWAMSQQGTETVEPLTIVVGVDHAPPLRILKPSGQSGLHLEVFEAIADRLGWSVEYREAPFRRTLKWLRQGTVDVVLGVVRTEEREEFMAFTAPAFPPERRLFFYTHEANRIDRYRDLNGKAVGVLEEARYFTRFDGDPALMKMSAERYESLMQMLKHGQVDVVVAPEMSGVHAARESGSEVRASPFFVPGDRTWIAVSRESPALRYAEDIRAALKLIDREGVWENLVLKYMEQPLN